MRLHKYLTPAIGLALLVAAGCEPVAEPGGLLEPLPVEDGLLAHATLDDSPIRVSDERRAELEPLLPKVEEEPAVDEAEATPEPVVEPSTPTPLEPLALDPVALESAGVLPEDAPATDEPGAEPGDPLVMEDAPAAEEATDGLPLDEASDEPLAVEPTGASEPADSPADPIAVTTPLQEPVTPLPTAELVTPIPPLDPALPTPESVIPAPLAAPTPSPSPALPTEELLPAPPASDSDAIAAIDGLDRREALPAPVLVLEDPSEISAPAKLCELQPALLRFHLSDFQLIEVSRLDEFALLRDPAGVYHRVQLGDRLGSGGGKITGIERSSIVVGEISLNPAGDAFISVETIRMAQ